jgi:hypothetical protein
MSFSRSMLVLMLVLCCMPLAFADAPATPHCWRLHDGAGEPLRDIIEWTPSSDPSTYVWSGHGSYRFVGEAKLVNGLWGQEYGYFVGENSTSSFGGHPIIWLTITWLRGHMQPGQWWITTVGTPPFASSGLIYVADCEIS